MNQSTNLKSFDDWMTWKENSYPVEMRKHYVKKADQSIMFTCINLGLRPNKDFHLTSSEVRFRTKSFLAMFKLNYENINE
tara:strand:+ start:1322 stop:1561 length:240 start_codon:yes stop_codon:yes gene_type:complete